MNLLQRLGLVKATLPSAARQPEREVVSVATTQGYPSWNPSPFGGLSSFQKVPQAQNLEIYEQMVQMVPSHNGALKQFCNLLGCPTLESEDKTALQEHNDWRSRLQVNRSAVGFDIWFCSHVINTLTYGLGAAEIVLTGTRGDVYALNELHPRTLELRPRQRGYGVDLVQGNQPFGVGPVVLNPDLILKSVHDLRDDHPWGKGALFGMNTTGQIYSNMLQSLGQTWERFGVPNIVGVCKLPPNTSDPQGRAGATVVAAAKAAVDEVMRSRSEGKPKNLVMVGDWEFSILGGQGDTLDIVGPGRHINEQHVASFNLPPMLLGFQWQAGERIGWVQAGLASKRIDLLRAHFEPQIMYLFRLRQALIGRPFEWQLKWEAPSLIDRGEDAKAELTEQQADKTELDVLEREWRWGVRSAEDVARARRPELKDATDAEVRAACPDLLTEPPMPMSPFGGGQEETEEGGPTPAENRPFGRSADLVYSKGVFGKNGRGGKH